MGASGAHRPNALNVKTDEKLVKYLSSKVFVQPLRTYVRTYLYTYELKVEEELVSRTFSEKTRALKELEALQSHERLTYTYTYARTYVRNWCDSAELVATAW